MSKGTSSCISITSTKKKRDKNAEKRHKKTTTTKNGVCFLSELNEQMQIHFENMMWCRFCARWDEKGVDLLGWTFFYLIKRMPPIRWHNVSSTAFFSNHAFLHWLEFVCLFFLLIIFSMCASAHFNVCICRARVHTHQYMHAYAYKQHHIQIKSHVQTVIVARRCRYCCCCCFFSLFYWSEFLSSFDTRNNRKYFEYD